MKNPFIKSSLFLASLIAFSNVYAGTATANLAVSATVVANCNISTSALAFGTYDTLAGTALNGTGGVTVSCTKGASGLAIGLGNGGSFSGGTRNMTSAGNSLSYNLYQPPSNTPGTACTFPGTTAWGNTVGTDTLALTNAPSKAARSYNVCGTVAANQDVPAGSYSDTVVATINF